MAHVRPDLALIISCGLLNVLVMKRSFIVFIALLILVALSAVASNTMGDQAKTIILLLTGVKFILISFYFMDLREAHVFWKIAVSVFLGLFLLITGLL